MDYQRYPCINKNKNRIYKRFCRTKDSVLRHTLHKTFKSYRNLITALTRQNKIKHYEEVFRVNKTNMKKTLITIKSIININFKNNSNPTCLDVNQKSITNHKQIAQEFNSFFTNIAGKIASKIIPTNVSRMDYLNNRNERTFFLSPTTPDEVSDQIKLLKNWKSSGPNSIPCKLLKSLCDTIKKPLSELINLSFSTGNFLATFKVAQVIPLHIKESKLECNNYRPISLLSNIGKIIEKIIDKKLFLFLDLDQCNIFYKNQFGFRFGHTTSQALITITETIRDAPVVSFSTFRKHLIQWIMIFCWIS